MKLVPFRTKMFPELQTNVRYHVMLANGDLWKDVVLFSTVVQQEHNGTLRDVTEYSFSNLDGDSVPSGDIVLYCRSYKFELLQIDDAYCITRDGNKFFKENTFGLCDHFQYMTSVAHMLQYDNDTYTPDTIKQGDLIEVLDGNEHGIVITVKQSKNFDDHGFVEVFLTEKRVYEHYTHQGWDTFIKVLTPYD